MAARRFFFLLLVPFYMLLISSSAFQSDELDDEEFGLEGGRSADPDLLAASRSDRRRRIDPDTSTSPTDSKSVQFTLEHAFGETQFAPAGVFTARLKISSHGGAPTLTKLRFSRNAFGGAEKKAFEKLLTDDDYYTIRLPSNVLNPPGNAHVISSVRARCLSREYLDEHFVIHMDGVNVVAVNYGSSGACQYPRPLKLPKKWSFNSYTVLKYTDYAKRTPTFAEDMLAAEAGESEGVRPIEKSFWAKYWMYLIPVGLIVMNAITAAMNMPEEQAGGQSASQSQQPAAARAAGSAIRRR